MTPKTSINTGCWVLGNPHARRTNRVANISNLFSKHSQQICINKIVFIVSIRKFEKILLLTPRTFLPFYWLTPTGEPYISQLPSSAQWISQADKMHCFCFSCMYPISIFVWFLSVFYKLDLYMWNLILEWNDIYIYTFKIWPINLYPSLWHVQIKLYTVKPVFTNASMSTYSQICSFNQLSNVTTCSVSTVKPIITTCSKST